MPSKRSGQSAAAMSASAKLERFMLWCGEIEAEGWNSRWVVIRLWKQVTSATDDALFM
jgi:hypothetical protein